MQIKDIVAEGRVIVYVSSDCKTIYTWNYFSLIELWVAEDGKQFARNGIQFLSNHSAFNAFLCAKEWHMRRTTILASDNGEVAEA